MSRAECPASRRERQETVFAWVIACFGREKATSVPQKAIRLLEEAVECAQAAGCDQVMARALVDHVYARPVGELGREIGGVGLTLLGLAAAAGLDADEEEVREIERVLSRPHSHFTARDAMKDAAGFFAVKKVEKSEGEP